MQSVTKYPCGARWRTLSAFAGLTALGIFSGATTANAQTALSFVTSTGVQIYDLTYVNSSNFTTLFPGTPTTLPDVPLGIVVFSPTLGDPSLIGKSFEDVFGVSEADVVGQITGTRYTDGPPTSYNTFLTKLYNNYPFVLPSEAVTTAQGVLFSNGQDIGTIKLDPPQVGVFGLAAQVPEPGPLVALAALALGCICQVALLRRRRASGR